jgi:hypothetical protein
MRKYARKRACVIASWAREISGWPIRHAHLFAREHGRSLAVAAVELNRMRRTARTGGKMPPAHTNAHIANGPSL